MVLFGKNVRITTEALSRDERFSFRGLRLAGLLSAGV
jgi:hypothetical protein